MSDREEWESKVADAILAETPASYVSQNVAQAYRNAEIALAILDPLIRADEHARLRDLIIPLLRTSGRHLPPHTFSELETGYDMGLDSVLDLLGWGMAMGDRLTKMAPHPFKRRGWRFWICDLCYAPRSLHPRTESGRARPEDDHTYYSKDAPHFEEGW